MGDRFRELRELLKNNDWDGVFKRPTDNIAVQFVRNPLAGLAAFAVDYLLLYILTELGIHFLISAAIAFIIGTTVNYFLCKVIVFNAYIPRFKNMPEYTIFIIIGVIGLGLTELLMYLFTDVTGFHYLLSKIVSGTLVSLWNFFGRRFFLFNNYENNDKKSGC
jgi:putative flippase GtrA